MCMYVPPLTGPQLLIYVLVCECVCVGGGKMFIDINYNKDMVLNALYKIVQVCVKLLSRKESLILWLCIII